MKKNCKYYVIALLFLLTISLCMPFRAYAAATGTHKPLGDNQVTVGVSGATDNKMSNGAVTVTAQGSGGIFGLGASAKTATITVTNDSGNNATVSFNWTATSVNELKIDGIKYTGTSGTFSKLLNSGESFKITITTAKNGTTNKLVMSGFALVAAAASSNVTIFYDNSLGSVTADGSAITSGQVVSDVTVTEGVALAATAKSGAVFLGWIDISDNSVIPDSAASFTFTPGNNISVKAVFASNSTEACFWTNSKTYLYESLSDAIAYASSASDKTIVLAANGTLASGNYTIPSGVTLLIPRNAEHSVDTTKPASTKPTEFGKLPPAPTPFRKLTMASGANITVNGAISIAGTQWAGGKYISTTGPVGFIQMTNGSSITINDKGNLYAWGYITGDGLVTAKSGATIYEQFQVGGWRGGDVTKKMVDSNGNRVFPMSQYYVQNIEVPLKLEAGAKEYTHASCDITLIGIQEITVDFVGTENSMFIINSGYVIKDYIEGEDRLNITVEGDVSLSPIEMSMTLGLLGGVTLKSKDYELPLNHNMTVHCESGNIVINQNVALLPGARIIIDEGTTCTLGEGVSIYIYDSEKWGNYCGSQNELFIPVAHAPGRTYTRKAADLVDAQVEINGTIDASKGSIFSTGGNSSIYSTGTGVILMAAQAGGTTYQVTQNADKTVTYAEFSTVSAMLKNADDSYVQSGTNTYIYMDGVWMPCFMTNVNLGNNLDIYFAILNYDTNISVTLIGPDDKTVSSSLGDLPDGDEIGIPKYKYIVYGDLAAKQMTDTITVTIKSGNKVIDIWSDSIQNYAMRLYNKDTTSEKLKAVIVDMLNYGAACQVQFDYNTKNLANAQLGNAAKDYDKKETGALENDLNASEISIAVRNLEVKSNILFHIAFNGNVAGQTVNVSFTGHKGNSESFDLTVAENGTIVIDKLVVADYNSVITLTFADGTVLKTKLIDYIEHLGGSETNNVFYAFKEFAESAHIYLHSKNTQGGQA